MELDLKHVGIFIISFAIGMGCLMMSPVEHKTVVVFPTPFNTKQLQYKDQFGACHRFTSREVECTSNARAIPKA